MKFDIIGDIHGYADELILLLEKLEYDNDNGTYRHPEPGRKAIFVGDFIDRGPKIKEALSIVKSMVDHDAAYAVLGNHEYNALCFHTLKAGHTDSWLRPHNDKNINQHIETLHQFKDHQKEWEKYLDWFLTLPLFLDLGDIRVVHASWIPSEISKIIKWTSGTLKLSKSFLQKSAIKGFGEFDTIEMILKGVEIPLPDGVGPFTDKDGHPRKEIRIQWWKSAKGKTYEEMFFPQGNSKGFGGHLIQKTDAKLLPLYENNVPVFFGHYWLNPINSNPPQVQAENICCLDYSVAKKGLLTAYRWEGEKILRNDRFVWV
ncbi:metallophosphoesterase [Thermodesulfobacteriota bacterium]